MKPSLAAFTLPLVQVSRDGGATRLWGQVRPGTGARRYVLQRRVGTTWRSLGGGTTSSRGYFTRTVRADAGTRVRLWDPTTQTAGAVVVVT